MKLEELSYPIYRKRKNNKSFYKIISSNQFEEIQIMGTKINFYCVEVSKYPEKLLMFEIIALEGDLYEAANSEEWNVLKLKKGAI